MKLSFVLDKETKTESIKLSCPNNSECVNHMVFWVDVKGEIRSVFGASWVIFSLPIRFRCDKCGSEFLVKKEMLKK